MKNLKYKLIYTGMIFFALTTLSCKKFLSKNPDSRMELNTPDKVQALLVTAYPQAAYEKICEQMSDNAADKGPVQPMELMDSIYFSFGDFVSDDQTQDSPTEYWTACYHAIATANAALDAIAAASNPADYAASKGEALLCRAYAHFMLVTLFAKPYSEATSANDPGVPYVTKPEDVAVVHYDRGTVQQDYDSITNDLEAGMLLIDDDNYTVPKYHFTRVAANAFATRFYLYSHNYTKALQYATKAFSNNAAFIANMRNWSKYLTYTTAEFQQNYTKATENANLLLVENPSLWARSYITSRFGYAPSMNNVFWTSSPFASNGSLWMQYGYVYIAGGQSNLFIPKWNEYFYAPTDPNYGFPYIMTPVFTTEEVLFNKAEAEIYLGQYQNALNDMNLYASQRLLNYSAANAVTLSGIANYFGPATDTKTALIQSLLYLKRIEFIQEGMRWFDILRYGIPVVHQKIDNNNNVTATYTLDSTDKRRQWQLPQAAISAGIPANPR